MNKRVFPVFVMAAALLFSFSGCGLFPEEEDSLAPPLAAPADVTYTTTKVEKGTIVDSVATSGTFVSTRTYDLSFEKRAGYLAEILVKPGDAVKKDQLLARLDTDELETEIKKQKLYVERAEIALNAAYETYDYDTIRLAEIEYDLQKLQLDESQNELSKQYIYAPDDGIVSYLAKEGPGEYVAAYSTFLRVVDPESLQVECSGDSVGDFQLDQKVTLTIDKKEYSGKVVMTSANAPRELLEEGKSFVRVAVTDALPKGEYLGKSANVQLIRQKKEDVIVIPRNVVSLYSGESYVMVLENGVKKERIIEPGIKNVTSIEVLSGLSEGEDIIIK